MLCEAKAICGTRSLRVTVVALFFESVKRRTKTKKIEKNNNNKMDKIKPQTRQKFMQFGPRMNANLFLCSILVNLGPVKGISHRKSIKRVSQQSDVEFIPPVNN